MAASAAGGGVVTVQETTAARGRRERFERAASTPWAVGLALVVAAAALFFVMRSETSPDRAEVVAAEQAEVLGGLTAVSNSDSLEADGVEAWVQGEHYCVEVDGSTICGDHSVADPFITVSGSEDDARTIVAIVPYAIDGFEVETGLVAGNAKAVTDGEHTMLVVRGDLVDTEAELLIQLYEGTVLRTGVQVTLVR